MLNIRGNLGFVIAISLFTVLCPQCWGQSGELTRKEKQNVRIVSDEIDRAAKLYVGKKYAECAEAYNGAKSRIEAFDADTSLAVITELKPLHEKLVRARKLLSDNGQAVDLPNALPKPKGGPISFSEVIAPMLVANCGNCHVSESRGRFGMATYTALMNSRHVVPGQPVESRIAQMIDTGEMPKGGGKVSDEDFAALKQWIAEGANSDADENANLGSLNAADPNRVPPPESLAVAVATGKESVSFSRDVAPILLENCGGCHIDANQPRANLNMTNFAGLLRGGDNGAIVKPGSSGDSLLIKKLNGTADGVRMPQGKNPLVKASIDLISKWIDEGAKFDGGDSQLAIRTITERFRASQMTHEELAKERLAISKKTWNTFNQGHQYHVVSTNEVQMFNGGSTEQLEGYAQIVDAIVAQIKRAVRADENQPLIKGKVTIMFVDERYDFNEYGVMILGHDMPPTLKAAWHFDQVDAHIVMLLAANDDGRNFEVELCRNLCAIYNDSLAPDVPRWFADGMGHSMAAKIYKNSEEAASWEPRAMELVRTMAQPDDFIEGRLPEDQAGLVSYYFLSQLRANGGRFGKLVSDLTAGKLFNDSFTKAYGQSPKDFLQSTKK